MSPSAILKTSHTKTKEFRMTTVNLYWCEFCSLVLSSRRANFIRSGQQDSEHAKDEPVASRVYSSVSMMTQSLSLRSLGFSSILFPFHQINLGSGANFLIPCRSLFLLLSALVLTYKVVVLQTRLDDMFSREPQPRNEKYAIRSTNSALHLRPAAFVFKCAFPSLSAFLPFSF